MQFLSMHNLYVGKALHFFFGVVVILNMGKSCIGRKRWWDHVQAIHLLDFWGRKIFDSRSLLSKDYTSSRKHIIQVNYSDDGTLAIQKCILMLCNWIGIQLGIRYVSIWFTCYTNQYFEMVFARHFHNKSWCSNNPKMYIVI